jgi:hypothetical protein
LAALAGETSYWPMQIAGELCNHADGAGSLWARQPRGSQMADQSTCVSPSCGITVDGIEI